MRRPATKPVYCCRVAFAFMGGLLFALTVAFLDVAAHPTALRELKAQLGISADT